MSSLDSCVTSVLQLLTVLQFQFLTSLFCMQLFVGGALLATDASAIHSMRAKRRVLLVRFIAKALLSPFYRQGGAGAVIKKNSYLVIQTLVGL